MTSPDQPMIEWLRYPEAEVFVAELLDQFVAHMPPVQILQADLMFFTSSRLVDWLDHLLLANGDTLRARLAEHGFEPQAGPAKAGDTVYHHPAALFPRIVLRTGANAAPGTVLAAAIQVEDAAEFLMTQHVSASIEGSLLSPYRRSYVWGEAGRGERAFLVVERRGQQGFKPLEMPPDYVQRYLAAYEKWATRPRQFDDARAGMAHTLALAQSLVGELGSDFSYLRQAFTRGERWQVSPERLQRLAAAGRIDQAQQERFSRAGTLGSHLENIQRGEGFKGFNQQTVSDIIRRTDPRVEPNHLRVGSSESAK